MSGMTGLQLAEELHRLHPRLPVLLATGFAELQATSAPALVRLKKPYRQIELAAAIEECLAAAAR